MSSLEKKSTITTIPYSCFQHICLYVGNIRSVFSSIALLSKYSYQQFKNETFSVAVSDMNHGSLIDSFFEFLSKLRILKSLRLHKVKLTSAHLASLEDSDYCLSKLKVLELSHVANEINLWDCCFAGELALETLVVSCSNVTYIGSLLAHTPKLLSLQLSHLRDFGNSDINQLEPVLYKLKHLKLRNLPITDTALIFIKRQIVNYCNTVSGNDLNVPSLMMERLEISCKNVTHHIFDMLLETRQYFPNLVALDVSTCAISNCVSLKKLLRADALKIKELGIGCNRLDDDVLLQCLANDDDSIDLASASDNTYIQTLSVKQSSISGTSLRRLTSKFMHTLCRLDVSWCNSIHGRDFEFLSGLKRLEELICNDNRRLDSNDVINLVLKLPTLRLLSCINCPGIKLQKLKSMVPETIWGRIVIRL